MKISGGLGYLRRGRYLTTANAVVDGPTDPVEPLLGAAGVPVDDEPGV